MCYVWNFSCQVKTSSKTVLANNSHSSGLSTTRSRSHGDLSSSSSSQKTRKNSFIPILSTRRSSRSNPCEALNHTAPEPVESEKVGKSSAKTKYNNRANHTLDGGSSSSTVEEAGSLKSNSKHKLKNSKVGEQEFHTSLGGECYVNVCSCWRVLIFKPCNCSELVILSRNQVIINLI